MGKSKGMQEKVSFMGITYYGMDRKPRNSGSLFSIMHSASHVMPISDPRDRFFYPYHSPMKDTYNLSLATSFLYQQQDVFNFKHICKFSMNKMSMQAIRTTLDSRSQVCDVTKL